MGSSRTWLLEVSSRKKRKGLNFSHHRSLIQNGHLPVLNVRTTPQKEKSRTLCPPKLIVPPESTCWSESTPVSHTPSLRPASLS